MDFPKRSKNVTKVFSSYQIKVGQDIVNNLFEVVFTATGHFSPSVQASQNGVKFLFCVFQTEGG